MTFLVKILSEHFLYNVCYALFTPCRSSLSLSGQLIFSLLLISHYCNLVDLVVMFVVIRLEAVLA